MWLWTIIYVGYHQRGERCSPTSLPRPSTSSAYCFNCAVNAIPRRQCSSSDKPDLPTTNVSYNFINNLQLAKPISSQDKHFINAFFSSFSAVISPQSRRKAYDTTESRSCTQMSHCQQCTIKYQQCIHKHHRTRYYAQTVDTRPFSLIIRMGLGTRLQFTPDLLGIHRM